MRRYLARDHAADLARWRRLAHRMADGLSGLPGVAVTVNDGSDRRAAGVQLRLDEGALGTTAVAVVARLAEGDPIVAVGQGGLDHGRIGLGATCLEDGEEDVVVARLREALAA